MRIAVVVLCAASAGCSDAPAHDPNLPEVDLASYEARARRLIEEGPAAARTRPRDGLVPDMAAMTAHAYQDFDPAAQVCRQGKHSVLGAEETV